MYFEYDPHTRETQTVDVRQIRAIANVNLITHKADANVGGDVTRLVRRFANFKEFSVHRIRDYSRSHLWRASGAIVGAFCSLIFQYPPERSVQKLKLWNRTPVLEKKVCEKSRPSPVEFHWKITHLPLHRYFSIEGNLFFSVYKKRRKISERLNA